MKGVILVFATLLLSTPLHAETIILVGTGRDVTAKIVKMCINWGYEISLKYRVHDLWLKCGDATEFTVVEKGDSVTVTSDGPIVQEMFMMSK